MEIAYYDQQREQLDPDETVFATIGNGNDTVTVNGRIRHVNAYLRDFLFAPEQANSPVKALSGGERNRLLLARLFTRPANVLVLDEPTNDLDIETLELLEEQLLEWPGTLLLVTHDRAFMDNVVTTTFAFEGDGHVREYVGGYEDWLRQRPAPSLPPVASRAADPRPSGPTDTRAATAVTSKKLSYKEQRELEALPTRNRGARVRGAGAERAHCRPRVLQGGPRGHCRRPRATGGCHQAARRCLHPLARARIAIELTRDPALGAGGRWFGSHRESTARL